MYAWLITITIHAVHNTKVTFCIRPFKEYQNIFLGSTAILIFMILPLLDYLL